MKIDNVVYMINSGCNFRCKFCLNNWKYDSKPMSNLKLDEKLKILDKLKEINVENLTISGGEPLLDKDLPDFVNYGFKLGFNMNLLTNGSLIKEEFLEKIEGKLESIQVSLEGDEDVHNLLTETRSYPSGYGKKNWKDLMIDVKEYEKFILQLNDLAVKNKDIIFRIAGPTPMCLLEKNKINLYFNTCGAGVNEIAINPDGEILPCPSWQEGIGNILKEDFKTILNNPKMKKITDRTELNSTCKTCNNFSKCKGGCLLHVINSSEGRDPYMIKV